MTAQPWHATVLTLYPEMFPGPLGISLAGRALNEGRWTCDPVQIRDFATDKHRSVDDTPAGGGAGMVLRADVVAAAIDAVSGTSAGGERPLLAIRAGGHGDISQSHRVWSFDNGPDVPTPVTDGTYFYTVNDRGIVYCLDAKSGRTLYGPQRIKPGSHMPNVDLRAAELHALLAYLEGLR